MSRRRSIDSLDKNLSIPSDLIPEPAGKKNICNNCQERIKKLKSWQIKAKKNIEENCGEELCFSHYTLSASILTPSGRKCPSRQSRFLRSGEDEQTECSEFWCTRGKLFANTPQHKTGWTIIIILVSLLITGLVMIYKKKKPKK